MAIDYLKNAVPPAAGQANVSGNPFEDLVKQFASAPPEKQQQGIEKLAQDFPGGPAQVLGVNPLAPPQVPGQPPVQEEPKSAWARFLTTLKEDPQFAYDLGAQLLAPRASNVSPLSQVATGLQTSMQRLKQRQAQEKQGQLAERKVQALEKQTDTGAQKVAADIKQTERNIESQDYVDDLRQAQAELARAKAEATTNPVSAATQKDVIYDKMMANVLYKNNPDKYANPDEALEAWAKFKVDKGTDPLAKVMIGAVENLPYMSPERVPEFIKQINEAMQGVGGLEKGATAKRLEELRRQAPPADQIPLEHWLTLEGENAADRKQAEEIYGADVVARKIEEAKRQAQQR